MPFKAGEPKASIIELFPKGAGAKPKEGGIPPSQLCELEASMSRALSKAPPASPAAPRRAVQLGAAAGRWPAAPWGALAAIA